MSSFTIEGHIVRAVSPEGQVAEMPLDEFLKALAPPRMTTCGRTLPRGTVLLDSRGPVTVLVHETPPQVRTLKWIATDSPLRSAGGKYRTVRVALPYLVVLAVFESGLISGRNECFFRNAPLEFETDQLLFPALLNCSRFEPPQGHPLSWICTQKLDRTPAEKEPDPRKRIRLGLKLLMQCLLETGFNYSSDDNEYSSWFTENTRVDPRVATIEKWEQATATEGPLFVLDVPWLPTEMSVAQVVERIFGNYGLPETPYRSERDLARIVFHHQRRPSRSA